MSTTKSLSKNSTDWWALPLMVGPGSDHMARDAQLLAAHLRGDLPSVVYCSLWDPPALSTGYHQQPLPARCAHIPQIQRPTGGRAVWHHGELSYTLITSGLTGTLIETYRHLAQVLISGFATLGVELTFGPDQKNTHQEACFATVTPADLCWQQYKVIGSAQLRRTGAILQQGSILIQPDYAQLAQLFPDTPLRIRGLGEILGYSPRPDLIQQALIRGVEMVFKTEVQIQSSLPW